MSTCTFRPAVPGDEELILSFIRALADYEHMSDQVVATPEILREWIFEKKTAEVIFAEVEGKAVGYALFSTTSPPSWAGRASIWRTCSSCLKSGGRGTARRCSRSWPESRRNGAAAGWSGPAWTGTGPPLTSIPKECAPSPWTSGRCTA